MVIHREALGENMTVRQRESVSGVAQTVDEQESGQSERPVVCERE